MFHCPIQVRHRKCVLRCARLVIRSVDSCCGAALPQEQLRDGQVARRCSRVQQRPLVCGTEQVITGHLCQCTARGAVCCSQDRYICYTTQPQLG